MKKETIAKLLDAAKRSRSEQQQDAIVHSILDEIGDNITSDNARLLWSYILEGETLEHVLRNLKL